jgi:hypothetical protein
VQFSWMDANLIQVAPECCDSSRLTYLYRGALVQKAYLPR